MHDLAHAALRDAAAAAMANIINVWSGLVSLRSLDIYMAPLVGGRGS
jgi:hypothetical protein